MARDEFKYSAIKGTKGINQQERLADPELELADARNLWAPNGRLEKRPGYKGIGAANIGRSSESVSATIVTETPLGTFTTTGTLSNLPEGDRWYVGLSSLASASAYQAGISLNVSSTNSNDIRAYVEYWNGSLWAPLNTVETDANLVINELHLEAGPTHVLFPVPADWALSTVNDATKYWLRFTLQNVVSGTTTLDGSVAIAAVSHLIIDYTTTKTSFVALLFPALFNSKLRFISGIYNDYVDPGTPPSMNVSNIPELRGANQLTELLNISTGAISLDEPASYAVVPQFDEVYSALDQKVRVHKAVVNTTADVSSDAAVETDATIVGTDADYAPAFVPQLGSWPEAQYIAFHRGEFWAANLKGASQQIRWSAAAPAYKVWPQISTDVAIDVDQSPITGLYAFNQNMFVFKDRSIWQMIYTGLNDQKLTTYRAEKVVAGVGCVSASSIQDIQGALIMLGQDGIYRFDGVNSVRISDRIQLTVDKILSGRRRHAVSTHWREKSLYMLAVTTAGAANNTVIIWDYKNDSWWIWDNIEATVMFSIPDVIAGEQIYFADRAGRIFQLGIGHNDNGTTITATGTSQRLSNGLLTQHIRSIEPVCTNTSRSLTIEVASNDAPMLGVGTTAPVFTDPGEKEYLTAVYDADIYTAERDRRAHVGAFVDGEWFRVKFTHAEKDAPFVLNELYIGTLSIGKRIGNG